MNFLAPLVKDNFKIPYKKPRNMLTSLAGFVKIQFETSTYFSTLPSLRKLKSLSPEY